MNEFECAISILKEKKSEYEKEVETNSVNKKWYDCFNYMTELEKAIEHLTKHSDENTEAYCENLQRENAYLKEQLSRQSEGEVIGSGKCLCQSDNESWLYLEADDGEIDDVTSLCEKYNYKNIIISVKEVE